MSQNLIDEYYFTVVNFERAAPADKNTALANTQNARSRLALCMGVKSGLILMLTAVLIAAVLL